MDRKVLDRMTVPIVAVCFLLADCTASTTTTPGPTTAFAVTRFTDAGALDTTFAGRGVAITDINPGLFDFAVAIAVQPDNKIIAAGSSGFAGAGIIALVRHNADGTLDTGFGTSGIVTTPTPTGWTSASATTVAVQPADSKIVVAAVVFNGPSGSTTGSTGIVLLRYNTDGKLDTGFGTGASGLATPLPIGSGFPGDTCGLVLQPDGKPVVVGASSDGKIVLARYTIAGILDTTFGDTSSGITTTPLNTLAGDSDIGLSPSIGLQSGGQIIVASVAGKSFGPPANHVVLRYGTTGALDTTFGAAAGGIVITDVAGGGNVDFPNALAVQSNDKIVVAGHANVDVNTGASDISLVRYNADGSLDTSFVGLAGNPTPGIVTTNLGGFDGVFSIALQVQPANEPKILVSGNVSSGAFPKLAVLRYNPDGTPDTTFDANGVATAPLVGPSNISSGNAVALQAVGVGFRIVVAGYD